MAGGYLQLAFYGAQDVYLTDEPSITFFKSLYRRYTNFSTEFYEQNIITEPDFGKRHDIILQKNGDMIHNIFLRIQLENIELEENENFAWTKKLGHAIIDNIQLKIGGDTIDDYTGLWLDIWSELSRSKNYDKGYNKMIGNVKELVEYNNNNKPSYTILIPLKFWFNKYISSCFPLITLEYHELEFAINLRTREELSIRNEIFDLNKMQINSMSLLTEYIYLDTKERNWFYKKNHDYLIEQVQYERDINIKKKSERVLLNFKNPSKELVWIFRNSNYIDNNKFLCYTHDKKNWNKTIKKFSKNLILSSILLLDNENSPFDEHAIEQDNNLNWENFENSNFVNTNSNGKINVINKSNKILWLNNKSLYISGNNNDENNLIEKISANIFATTNENIYVEINNTDISINDISIPLKFYNDERIIKESVIINDPLNYGLLLNGELDIMKNANIDYNDRERITKKNNNFFNLIQPYTHHKKIPNNGVYMYSFSIYPEKHQPSGTSNMTKIDNIILKIEMEKKKKTINKNIYDKYLLDVYTLGYNILKIENGLSAVVYN